MYRCGSWTIKKAEHQKIDAFKLWCWRRLLRVPWTARRSNQSILKEINPEYPLDGLMLKLKLQSFGQLMWRADLLERPWWWERLKATWWPLDVKSWLIGKDPTLMLGKIEVRRRRGQQRTRWLNSLTDSMDMSLSKLWETLKDREAWQATVHGATKSWTGLSDWITSFSLQIQFGTTQNSSKVLHGNLTSQF